MAEPHHRRPGTSVPPRRDGGIATTRVTSAATRNVVLNLSRIAHSCPERSIPRSNLSKLLLGRAAVKPRRTRRRGGGRGAGVGVSQRKARTLVKTFSTYRRVSPYNTVSPRA